MLCKKPLAIVVAASISLSYVPFSTASETTSTSNDNDLIALYVTASSVQDIDFSNDLKLGASLFEALEPILTPELRIELRSALDNGWIVPSSFEIDRSVSVKPGSLVLSSKTTLDAVVEAYQLLETENIDEFKSSLVLGVAELYGVEVAISDDDSNPWLIGLGVLGGAVAAGGMGGSSESGGSDNGTYRDTIEAPAYLAEYQAQHGLSTSNVASLNNYG